VKARRPCFRLEARAFGGALGGWLPETTLLYVPRVREGYDLDIAVVGRMV
jgi:hypothetical protein